MANTIRVTKLFNFEMAHALYGYDGPCKNIHGHSYQLSVTVIGKPIEDLSNPKAGMVIDFSVLKKIVEELIVKKYDHTLVLNIDSPHKELKKIDLPFERLEWVYFQPTCEKMLIYFAGLIAPKLPDGIKLHHLTLKETPNSYAEWYASDN